MFGISKSISGKDGRNYKNKVYKCMVSPSCGMTENKSYWTVMICISWYLLELVRVIEIDVRLLVVATRWRHTRRRNARIQLARRWSWRWKWTTWLATWLCIEWKTGRRRGHGHFQHCGWDVDWMGRNRYRLPPTQLHFKTHHILPWNTRILNL